MLRAVRSAAWLPFLFAVAAAGIARAGEAPGSAADPPSILVTRQLAEARGLRAGDVVLLSADPRGLDPRPFRVAGTYEPIPDPMRLTARRWEARLHLPDLQDLTARPGDPAARETVGSINVALAGGDLTGFRRELETRAPGVFAWPSAGLSDGGPFLVLERFHLAISAVTVIGASAFLLALMVMRAEERREVAGILRLVGFTRRRVLLLVLLEGLVVAAAGAAFGVAFAAATQGVANSFFQWRYDTALVFVRITPGIALRCILLAVPLGVLSGVLASWTLLRGEISALLKR